MFLSKLNLLFLMQILNIWNSNIANFGYCNFGYFGNSSHGNFSKTVFKLPNFVSFGKSRFYNAISLYIFILLFFGLFCVFYCSPVFFSLFHYNSVSLCQGIDDPTFDNLFFKIEDKGYLWEVLFKNVYIKYEVTLTQFNNPGEPLCRFEFREIGPNYPGESDPHCLWGFNNFDEVLKYLTDGGELRLLDPRLRSYNPHFIRNNPTLFDAVRDHFNDIQRGNIHPNAQNFINPNPHGKGTNVLANVSNTFGIHNTNVWPSNNPSVSSNTNNIIASNSIANNVTSTSASASSDSGFTFPIRGRGIRSPLDQFIMRDLLTIRSPMLNNASLTYTNMNLYLSITTLFIISLMSLVFNYGKSYYNWWSITLDSIFTSVYGIVVNQINLIKGQNYYPFIYCLFVFILVNNLIGMVPYSFSPTSHFVLTFFISFTVVFGSTILGFEKHNLSFFSILVPDNCPLNLLPLLVLIEAISYIARCISLGLRLAANILSGHMLLNILSEFTYDIMDTNISQFMLGLVPLSFVGAFSALESGIAFIQAQVFTVLSSSYMKDGLLLH